ncbi:meprin A subunit beta-like [Astyanax mexicanus]|uniref:meprin A subunit beta-like n=1 Tax=Astyanax mexicanus TaxID=7994 RepID=UPI0020CB31D9|nr:meprin A subunit beta-like [Astyanax mexicanus]
MDFLMVLLLSLAVSPVSLLPPPTLIGIDGEFKDIFEINKDLNLYQGDIMVVNKPLTKSAILSNNYRWNGYIPYVLNNSLSINDKGVILRAFEQLRLKGCIDFKPRTTETDYVSVEAQTGCWSYIGRIGGRQQLSIGSGCGYIGIVEHEFLHCLGFFHEQSRYDRDDYVTIHYENIPAVQKHNFDKVSEAQSTVQGTPYDYRSLMHYGQYDFSNTSGPTIITKDVKFQTFIGQRYDLSPLDAVELYNLYKCNESISFLDRCSFKDGTCQMATCSSANAGNWQIVSNVSGGPSSDHTNLPPMDNLTLFINNISSEPPFFMHFSTKTGQPGDSGRLESREMTPRRSCNVQCLEFFYYHSGNETDQLNIWIREYQSAYDTVGTLRLMDQITGPPTDHWQFRLVPLDASKTFQVEFEARKGDGYSRGGFSVDDINLSETECPHSIWQINNFMEAWNKTVNAQYLFSPLYYSAEGYRFQLHLLMTPSSIGLYIRLVSGIYDDRLQWPCSWRQVTFTLLDQNPDIRNRASKQTTFTTDPTTLYDGKPVWGRPSEAGSPVFWGFPTVLDKAHFGDREFVKGGDLIILASMQDLSPLQQSDTLPCTSVPVMNVSSVPLGAQKEACVARSLTTRTPATSTTTPSDKNGECLDIFCSSADIVHPSVVLLLALVLMLVNSQLNLLY